MAAGNLYALQKFFDVNWTAKWCTEPTWYAREAERKHYSGDSIVYEAVESPEPPVSYNQQWVDRKEVFKFRLRSTTQGNLELMKEELKYMVANLFYPAPFTPVSHEAEVLAYYDCNHASDNTGGAVTLYDYQTTYDLDFGHGALNNPSWVTTGALNRKQYLHMDSNEGVGHATLLDTMPSALTIEVIARRTTGAGGGFYLRKYNTVAYYLNLYDPVTSVVWRQTNAGGSATLAYGYSPPDKWVNMMGTLGPRGMELYLNGVLIGTSPITSLPANGTEEDFLIGFTTCVFDFSILRISNVQRLPWDTLTVSALKKIQTSSGYYLAECEIVGTLSNIYVGGSL